MSNTSSNTAEPAQHWQRLSPWAILYFIVNTGYRLIADGFLNMLPVLVLFVVNVERKIFWATWGGGIALLALVAYGCAYYATFRFRVQGDAQVLLHKGVFTKERLALRFTRVQNINLATPFYFAPLGRTNCQFDAAGSSDKEIVLPALSNAHAQQLRRFILASKQRSDEEEADTEQEAQVATSADLALPNHEVAKYGLMSNMALLALAALMPIVNMVDGLFEQVVIANLDAFFNAHDLLAAYAEELTLITLLIAAVILTVGGSVIMALLRFYNFELFIEQARFRRVAGLLERQQLSMCFTKVQSATIKQNWVAVLLRRYTLSFAQVATFGPKHQQDKQSLILPVLTHAQMTQMMATMFPWFANYDSDLQPVSRRYFWHRVGLFAALPLATVSCSLAAFLHWAFIALALLILPLALYHYCIYKRLGWQLVSHQGQEFLIHRSGLIGSVLTVCELFKAQQVSVVQTALMAKAQVATISIQFASKRLTLPFMPEQQARMLADRLLFHIETDQRAWF
ncbi:stress protein [Pseudoalteromonas ruthenica]|uniref:Stress protein n=1 Tax=Pseudoalteromonas ruthenica TaxID=151081 RepID=A0A5S3Z1C2_9GAMM|nr:PH domain-containing protein [Pseudoalteromonas ruthenica]TMP86022.1 stress protein [Pseudoalteromonas ruthenica]